MTLNYVNLTLDYQDPSGNVPKFGAAYIVLSVQLTDADPAGHGVFGQIPVRGQFSAAGAPIVRLLANDNTGALPAGSAYTISFAGIDGSPAGWSFAVNFADGPDQNLSEVTRVADPVTMTAYLAGSYPGGTTSFLRADGTWATLADDDSLFIPASAEGAANGVATLDSGAHVPVGQIPALPYDASGAAATAQANAKAYTDLVTAIRLKSYATGDGVTDDSAAVQNWLTAVANASGLGGEGYADPGTYLIGTTPALSGKAGVKIRGAGTAALFKAKAATQPNLLSFTNCSKVKISNIAMDGNRSNVTQLGTQYTALNGIYIQGCDDVTVEDCRIDNVYVSGVMANGGCANVVTRGNRLTNCGDNQIYIRAQNTAPYTPCSNITAVGNVCSGGSFSGIQFLGSSDITAVGNVCFGNGPTAAQGDGIGSEGCSDFTFTGNVCYNNGVQGIQSRFTNEVGTSQQSTNGVISGNVCYGHTSSNGDAGGIGVNDTDTIELTGNVCFGNYYGINVNGGNGLGVSHLHIAGGSSKGNNNVGLRLAPGSGSDYVIDDLYCVDNAADNLFASAVATIQGGYYRRASGTHQGIHLAAGSGGSVITGADISNNTDNGILIDAGVGPVDIRNCWFNGSGTDQNRAVQEQATAGPTTMVNCKIQNQKTNLYVFNNAASRFVNEGAPAANFKPANPAATTSLTLVMMGLGSACAYTPAGSGKVMVNVTAYGDNATGNAGITCGPRFGTGAAPANGVAVTGTRFGGAQDPGSRPSGLGSGAGVAFAFTDLLTLTAGTAYWFDLSLLTGNAADAASLINVSMTFVELS